MVKWFGTETLAVKNGKPLPLEPKMKVLKPRNMGEVSPNIPSNEGKVVLTLDAPNVWTIYLHDPT